MNHPRMRWLPAASAAAVIGAWIGLVFRLDLFRPLGVPARPEPFLDLRFVLAALDAWRSGVDVRTTMPPGEWVTEFNYPYSWLLGALTPLGLEHASWLGTGMIVVTILAALHIVRVADWPAAAATVLVVGSPAILFGFERGNVDILMFLLAWAAWWLAATPRSRPVAAAICIAVASVLKLYPLVIFGVLAVLPMRPRTRGGVVGLGVLGGTIAVWQWWLIRDLLPSPTARYSFGLHPLLAYLGLPASGAWLVAALLAFGVGTAALIRPLMRFLPSLDERATMAFHCGVAVLGFCFVATPSFDYRLVFVPFLLPYLIGLARQHDSSRHRRIALVALGGTLIALWAEFADVMIRVVVRRLGASQEFALAVQPFIHIGEHLATAAAMALLIALAWASWWPMAQAAIHPARQPVVR